MVKKLEDKIKEIKNLTSTSLKKRRTGTYSYIDPDDVVIMIKEGLKMLQIADVYNCSTHTIRHCLRSKYFNFDARKYFEPESKVTDKEVIDAYKELKSSTEVGKLLEISAVSVLRRLQRAGVVRNPRTRYDITAKKILELYGKYKNMKNVAEELNTDCSLLGRRLKDAGIKLDLSSKRIDIPKQEVLDLYDKDKSISEIARKYDACFTTIRKIIVDSGRRIKSERASPGRTDITPEKAARLYREYGTVNKVAEKLSSNVNTIRDRLKKAGVEIKKGGEPKISGKLEEKIIKEYQFGISMEKIAIKNKVTTSTVSKVLDRNNIKKRKRSDYFI